MAPLTPCPPWLLKDGAALMARAARDQLPHALLLSGIDGIGKRRFARWLAEALLCRRRSEAGACGGCDACHQLTAGSHPDFLMLAPEGASAVIKVDAVRELTEWIQLTAGQGSYRVALLEQADSLNHSAANSLLKTLEEPGAQAVLILTATRTGALPATIRSRCQKITLGMHDRAAAIVWLAEMLDDPETALLDAGGAPYAAMTRRDEEHVAARTLLLQAWNDLFLHKGSVGRISTSLSRLDTALCLSTFSRWTLLAVRQLENLPIGADPAVVTAISATHEQLEKEQWFTVHDRLLQLHRSDSTSFKTQTVLEGIFADIRLMTNR
ncbi:MAG: DNA polymerase III subunit delta' [Granulosicoccus sp.]|nr:DNA polymerase III subunit delta' [Granulosicoccus sp.]